MAAGEHPKTPRGFWLRSWAVGPDSLCLRTALLCVSKPEETADDRSLLPHAASPKDMEPPRFTLTCTVEHRWKRWLLAPT